MEHQEYINRQVALVLTNLVEAVQDCVWAIENIEADAEVPNGWAPSREEVKTIRDQIENLEYALDYPAGVDDKTMPG